MVPDVPEGTPGALVIGPDGTIADIWSAIREYVFEDRMALMHVYQIESLPPTCVTELLEFLLAEIRNGVVCEYHGYVPPAGPFAFDESRIARLASSPMANEFPDKDFSDAIAGFEYFTNHKIWGNLRQASGLLVEVEINVDFEQNELGVCLNIRTHLLDEVASTDEERKLVFQGVLSLARQIAAIDPNAMLRLDMDIGPVVEIRLPAGARRSGQ